MVAIFRPSEPGDRESLVQETAKVVASLIRTNLSPGVANMTVAELCGYLRTRATREARDQVRRLVSEVRWPEAYSLELSAAVTERAIHLAIRDLAASPTVAIPTPHVQSRAA